MNRALSRRHHADDSPAVPEAARLAHFASGAHARPPDRDARQSLDNQAVQAMYRRGSLHAKLELQAADTPEEQQADAFAERVMRTPDACCSNCATGGSCDRPPVVQRSSSAHEGGPGALSAENEQAVTRLTTGGDPLPAAERSFFEPRLVRDLGDVRIHHDEPAQDAARAISAKAFTVGSHIGFGAGRWAPGTSAGRHLLAHELAHVQQSSSNAHGDTARASGNAAVRRAPGDPALPEPVPPFKPAPGQLGAETSRVTHSQSKIIDVTIQCSSRCGWTEDVQLRFDPDKGACRIDTGADVEFVPSPNAARRLSNADFETLAGRYMSLANSYFEGWYAVRITGDQCGAPCQNLQMPIHVHMNRAKGGKQIILSSGDERENAGEVHAGTSDWTLRHEAAHVSLGAADEYEEAGEACREGENVEERDWSLMAKQTRWTRRSLLHPRHFSHIVTWFQHEYPGCRIELVPLRVPSPIDFDVTLTMGAGFMGKSQGLAYDLGLRVGFPLDRLRDWAFSVGPHAHMLMTTGNDESRTAYLLGLRFGLEKRFTPSTGGPILGGFAEFGYGRFGLTPSGDFTERHEGSPFVLAGLRAGYAFPENNLPPAITLDASVGAPLGVPGVIGTQTGSVPPQTRETWWQLGLSAIWRY